MRFGNLSFSRVFFPFPGKKKENYTGGSQSGGYVSTGPPSPSHQATNKQLEQAANLIHVSASAPLFWFPVNHHKVLVRVDTTNQGSMIPCVPHTISDSKSGASIIKCSDISAACAAKLCYCQADEGIASALQTVLLLTVGGATFAFDKQAKGYVHNVTKAAFDPTKTQSWW